MRRKKKKRKYSEKKILFSQRFKYLKIYKKIKWPLFQNNYSCVRMLKDGSLTYIYPVTVSQPLWEKVAYMDWKVNCKKNKRSCRATEQRLIYNII